MERPEKKRQVGPLLALAAIGFVGTILVAFQGSSLQSLHGFFGPLPIQVGVIFLLIQFGLLASIVGPPVAGFGLGLIFILLGASAVVQDLLSAGGNLEEVIFLESSSILQDKGISFSALFSAALVLSGIGIFSRSKFRGSRSLYLFSGLSGAGLLAISSAPLMQKLFSELASSPAGRFSFQISVLSFFPGILLFFGNVRDFRRMGVKFTSMASLGLGLVGCFVAVLGWLALSEVQRDTLGTKSKEIATRYALATNVLIARHSNVLKRMLMQVPASQGAEAAPSWSASAEGMAKDLGDVWQLQLYGAQNELLWNYVEKTVPHVDTPELTAVRNEAIQAARTSGKLKVSRVVEDRSGPVVFMALAKDGTAGQLLVAKVKLENFFSNLSLDDASIVELVEEGKSVHKAYFYEEDAANNWAATAQAPNAKVRWSLRVTPVRSQLEEMSSKGASVFLVLFMLFTFILSFAAHLRTYLEDLMASSKDPRFDLVSSLLPIGIFEADAKGQFRSVNSAWSQFTGAQPDQLVGDGWKQFIHPEDREKVEGGWAEAAASGGEWTMQYRFRAGDGAEYPVRIRATPMSTPDGALSGFVGSLEVAT